LALIYSTVLPVLLLAETMCNLPLSYANSGISFTAIGVLAALLVRPRGRILLARTPLVSALRGHCRFRLRLLRAENQRGS
jgi:hypothetical protein